MRRAIAALLLPALLLAGSACTYFDRRMTDLADCFVWRWHSDALGFGADAKLGPVGAAVGGWYAEWGRGKDTWWQRPGYTLTNHGTGVPITTIGPLAYAQPWSRFLATSSTGNHPGDPNAYDDVDSWLGIADVFDLDDERPFALSTTQRIVDAFGVEVGVAPVFCQLHVGFNIAEFADFLLGWVGIDAFGDDGVERPATVPVLPEPPPPVRRR